MGVDITHQRHMMGAFFVRNAKQKLKPELELFSVVAKSLSEGLSCTVVKVSPVELPMKTGHDKSISSKAK